MAEQNNENRGNNNPIAVAYRRWGKKFIAAVIVVAMVLSSAAYTLYVNSQIQEIVPTQMEAEDGQIIVSGINARERMEAIGSAVTLQNKLNEDYQTAIAAIEAGDYVQAIEPIKELLMYLAEDKNVGTSLRMTLAELYYMTNDYEKCHLACVDIMDRDEDSAGTYAFMDGVALMGCGKYEQSMDMLEHAINVGYSEAALCKTQIALNLFYLGRYQDALNKCDEILAMENVDTSVQAVVWYVAGLANIQLGQYEEAIASLDRLIEVAPDAEYYYDRGVAKMVLEDYASAADDFKSAVAGGYADTSCYYNYGVCAYMAGRADEAEFALTVVAERNDDPAYAEYAKTLLDALKGEDVEVEAETSAP